MVSSHESSRHLLLCVVAVWLSAVGFYFSYGLEPVWWLIWLAPLPVLLLAPGLSGWTAAASASLALGLGGLDMWSYHRLLHFPLWLSIAALVQPALVFALSVALYRKFFLRGQRWLAVLAFPTVIVAAEYLVSFWQGTFGNTAYTQLRNLPVLQLGSLTGLWGISFLVMLVPAIIAASTLSRGTERVQLVVALSVALASAVLYGSYRLHFTPAPSVTVEVGLAESDAGPNIFPQDPQPIMTLMHGYTDQVHTLAAQGANFVVLPEMTALVGDPLSAQIDTLFEQAAQAAHVEVLLGLLHVTDHGAFNEARLYSVSGTVETVYRKHHLVPVAEGRTTPGTDISVISETAGRVGIEICRDMDYPELARRYGANQVGLVLVPAWEFGPDRLWHGHMALMRAVEDGFTMVRSAKQGLLTVSDDRGRVLAEENTSSRVDFNTVLAEVPVRHDATLYQAWGDWFAWVDLAILAGMLLNLLWTRRMASIPQGQEKETEGMSSNAVKVP